MSTILEEFNALVSGNDTYTEYKDQWQALLLSYLGGDEYREGNFLQRYQTESDRDYVLRTHNTPLFNECNSVVRVYNSFLFKEPPQRHFNELSQSEDIQDFLKDADMDGRSFNSFMSDVATWSSVFGHCFIIMAKPDIGALTRADEIEAGVRPYVNLLTPLAVLDWNWNRRPSGRYELDYIRYVEDINGDIHTVKEWTPDLIKTSVADSNSKTVLESTEEVNGLGRIPVVVAYNGRSVIRGIGVSDIQDISSAQRFIFNLNSNIEESIRLDSHPSLVCTPETQISSGAGSIIHIDGSMDAGLKPYLLEHSGASVDSMLAAIDKTVEAIEKMANIGAVRATESRVLSGVSRETEFALLGARLSEKANALELAEEQLWRLWCAYQQVPYSVEIDYPGSFNIRDTGSELQQLKTARETAQNPVIQQLIDRRIVELLGEDPEEYFEVESYEMQPTQPGAERTAHIQEMIMSGYTDDQMLELHPEISEGDIDSAKRDLLDV